MRHDQTRELQPNRERSDREDRRGRGSDDEIETRGWGRDEYGFRGPRFHEREDFRDPVGLATRDHWVASGGYSEGHRGYGRSPRPDTARRRATGSYGSGPMPGEGSLRASNRGKGPKNFTRSDERIRDDVCERLADCEVDASNIEVRVTNCEVTLEGTVEDRRAKREAEDVICEVRGVTQVHNLLRVGVHAERSGTT